MHKRTLLATAALASFLLLAAVAEPAAAAEKKTFEIYLHEPGSGFGFHMAPDRITVNEGDTVELLVKNPEEQESRHSFHLEGYDVEAPPLEPGQSQTVTFTADKAGTFEMSCAEPGHKAGGERGTFVVQGTASSEKGTPSGGIVLALAAIGVAGILLSRQREA